MKNEVTFNNKLNSNFKIGQLILESFITFGRIEYKRCLQT
jgi:hypothetical protein